MCGKINWAPLWSACYTMCPKARHCLFFKEMTLNKMVWNFWHQFLIRFSMLFQMVPFILLCMVAHLTITWLVETIPTANQRALCWWFLKLPWREKRKVTSERAMKIESETGVKSDTPFCLRLPIEKTNSVWSILLHQSTLSLIKIIMAWGLWGNRHDKPGFIRVSDPLLTEFDIYQKLESCANDLA